MTYWIYLILAGISEIGFATCLKLSQNFTKLWPTVTFIMLSFLSFYLMNKAMIGIPMNIAYSVWVGIGILGISILEMTVFQGEVNITRIIFVATLLLSIIGLKFSC